MFVCSPPFYVLALRDRSLLAGHPRGYEVTMKTIRFIRGYRGSLTDNRYFDEGVIAQGVDDEVAAYIVEQQAAEYITGPANGAVDFSSYQEPPEKPFEPRPICEYCGRRVPEGFDQIRHDDDFRYRWSLRPHSDCPKCGQAIL